MKLRHIVFKSLRQHWLSTGLAVLSIALGVALLIAVVSLREQAHRNFTQEGLGVDAVLGPKGSPLQIVLNAVYHLDEMPGKIPWTYYEQVKNNPLVQDGFPFITGHSFGGYRVNAVEERFLTDFEYLPGKRFSFRPEDGGQGRPFEKADEAVAGAEVARDLGIMLGKTFNPVCGVNPGDPVHNENIRFVGILAPTGTPHDRAIYIPLTAYYTLGGHGADVARMATDLQHREISGAYLKIKHLPGSDAINPDIQDLQYNIKQSTFAQLVVPNEVLPRLFAIIGWADHVLLAIAVLVTVLGILFLFVALFSALRERRRDIALMRAMGAGKTTVFGLILFESLLMTLMGCIGGLTLGHALVALGAHFVKVETGLAFSAAYVSTADIGLIPVMLVLGVLAGLGPAVQAYRLGVLKNLTPIS